MADDEAEKARQEVLRQEGLAAIERDRQAAAKRAQEARDEEDRRKAREEAEALAAYQAMEARRHQQEKDGK